MGSCSIRSAMPEDAAGIAAVHVDSWRTTYPGILPDRYLVGLSVAEHERRWRRLLGNPPARRRQTKVACGADGVIVGFGSMGPQRTALKGYGGEFYALYLAEQVQGVGIGRRLLAAMAQDMATAGTGSAVVWVLRDNPARFFYERLGGTLVAEQPIRVAGIQVMERAYGWLDLLPLARMAADPSVGG